MTIKFLRSATNTGFLFHCSYWIHICNVVITVKYQSGVATKHHERVLYSTSNSGGKSIFSQPHLCLHVVLLFIKEQKLYVRAFPRDTLFSILKTINLKIPHFC